MLLCLDLERGSRELAQYAATRARRCQQSILILHVASPRHDDLESLQKQLNGIAETELAGVEITGILIEQGVPEDHIVAVAQQQATEMIILGRRKRPVVERIYVGSTTSAVLSLAGIPVLVVPLIEEFGHTDDAR
jgi:nucleotide-binding universal stress UspA family protein